jgi:hypothetical protein
LGGGEEILKNESPWVPSNRFNKKPENRIKKKKEPEDLSVKGLSLCLPIQKEEDSQTAGSLIELGGMEGDVQLG